MSDKDPSGPLPELTAEQEATVRRLLADARHQEPLPVDVGDRLDRVLADLSSDSSASGNRSPRVVDLAARRRRRNAGGLLVAAAAVIVGGFLVGQVIDVGGSGDSDSASGGGSTVARDAAGNDSAAEPEAAASPAPGDHLEDAPTEVAKTLPLELTSQNLARDVRRELPKLAASANLAASPGAMASYDASFSCATASPSPYGIGRLYPAYYDGIPTVLALRPATGGDQEAQVLECGTGAPLRSVIVPVP